VDDKDLIYEGIATFLNTLTETRFIL